MVSFTWFCWFNLKHIHAKRFDYPYGIFPLILAFFPPPERLISLRHLLSEFVNDLKGLILLLVSLFHYVSQSRPYKFWCLINIFPLIVSACLRRIRFDSLFSIVFMFFPCILDLLFFYFYYGIFSLTLSICSWTLRCGTFFGFFPLVMSMYPQTIGLNFTFGICLLNLSVTRPFRFDSPFDILPWFCRSVLHLLVLILAFVSSPWNCLFVDIVLVIFSEFSSLFTF